MGNWFETCAVSNLPIRTSDEVKIFFIRKKEFIYEEWRCGSESDKWYVPIDIPIDAYCHSEEEFRVKGNMSSSRIMEAQRGKNEGEDMMIILKPMYDAIINEMKTRMNFEQKLKKEVEEFVQGIKQLKKSEKDENFPLRKRMFGYETDFPGNRFVRFFDDSSKNTRHLLEELAETDNEELKSGMIETILFHYGLNVMRKMWHPGVGRGSQDTEYFLHKKIAEEIIKKEQEIKDKYLAENILAEGEEEDEITKMYMWYL